MRQSNAEHVDDHQRQMWSRMLDEIVEFEGGRFDLGKLVSDLRALFVEANPHDPILRNQFEQMWVRIDAEQELRTEPWAPAGSASDEGLRRALDGFRDWVGHLLSTQLTDDHG